MTELEAQAQSQLIAIEQIYGIRIENRDHIGRQIGEKAADRRQVLTICTALNSWVMDKNQCLFDHWKAGGKMKFT